MDDLVYGLIYGKPYACANIGIVPRLSERRRELKLGIRPGDEVKLMYMYM